MSLQDTMCLSSSFSNTKLAPHRRQVLSVIIKVKCSLSWQGKCCRHDIIWNITFNFKVVSLMQSWLNLQVWSIIFQVKCCLSCHYKILTMCLSNANLAPQWRQVLSVTFQIKCCLLCPYLILTMCLWSSFSDAKLAPHWRQVLSVISWVKCCLSSFKSSVVFHVITWYLPCVFQVVSPTQSWLRIEDKCCLSSLEPSVVCHLSSQVLSIMSLHDTYHVSFK